MSQIWKDYLKSFLQTSNAKQLATQLTPIWPEVFPDDKVKIYQFLFLSGAQTLFIKFLLSDLKNQPGEVPWLLFAKLLEDAKIVLPANVHHEVLEILKRLDLIREDANVTDSLLTNLKKNRTSMFLQQLQIRKHELLASARIAKSEQLKEQHLRYMDELRSLFPGEYNLNHLITEQEINRAQDILTKRLRKKKSAQEPIAPADESALIDQLALQSQVFVEDGKAKASDIAYLFRTFNSFDTAFEFLKMQDDSMQKDWQTLEYLYSGSQYISSLDHCAKLKIKYVHDPDALFSISYIEALSFWELGEKEKALEIMEQISSMRPQFKSATEILNHWKDESFD